MNSDKQTPPGFDVHGLTKKLQAQFACALQSRAALTWDTLKKQDRHKLGFEWIPKKQIRPSVPPDIAAAHDKFMVFRFHDKHPMAGYRVKNVFHIVWIERQYNELYNHGS